MKIFRLITRHTFTAFLFLAVSVAANAGVITYSTGFILNNVHNHDATSPYGNDTYIHDFETRFGSAQLSRFDSSLGTLTGVSISFTSDFDHHSYGYAYDRTATSVSYQQAYRCGIFNLSTCYRTVYRYQNDTRISGSASTSLQIALTDPAYAQATTVDSNNIYCFRSRGTLSSSYSVSCSDPENDINNAFNGALNLSGIALSSFIGTDDIDLSLSNYAVFHA